MNVLEILDQIKEDKDISDWQPANKKSFPFFTLSNRNLIYCINKYTGEYAYFDLDLNKPLSDDEVILEFTF